MNQYNCPRAQTYSTYVLMLNRTIAKTFFNCAVVFDHLQKQENEKKVKQQFSSVSSEFHSIAS